MAFDIKMVEAANDGEGADKSSELGFSGKTPAFVCQVSIVNQQGQVVVDTLVNPYSEKADDLDEEAAMLLAAEEAVAQEGTESQESEQVTRLGFVSPGGSTAKDDEASEKQSEVKEEMTLRKRHPLATLNESRMRRFDFRALKKHDPTKIKRLTDKENDEVEILCKEDGEIVIEIPKKILLSTDNAITSDLLEDAPSLAKIRDHISELISKNEAVDEFGDNVEIVFIGHGVLN